MVCIILYRISSFVLLKCNMETWDPIWVKIRWHEARMVKQLHPELLDKVQVMFGECLCKGMCMCVYSCVCVCACFCICLSVLE